MTQQRPLPLIPSQGRGRDYYYWLTCGDIVTEMPEGDYKTMVNELTPMAIAFIERIKEILE